MITIGRTKLLWRICLIIGNSIGSIHKYDKMSNIKSWFWFTAQLKRQSMAFLYCEKFNFGVPTQYVSMDIWSFPQILKLNTANIIILRSWLLLSCAKTILRVNMLQCAFTRTTSSKYIFMNARAKLKVGRTLVFDLNCSETILRLELWVGACNFLLKTVLFEIETSQYYTKHDWKRDVFRPIFFYLNCCIALMCKHIFFATVFVFHGGNRGGFRQKFDQCTTIWRW